MAISSLEKDIKEILMEAGRESRKELSRNKFETLVFEKRFIMEWCEYCQKEVGLTPTEPTTRKMTARFFKAIRTNFRKSGNLFSIHPIRGGGVELTKLGKGTKGFEFKRNALNQTLIECKQEALDVLNVKDKTAQSTELKSALHGHHGGPEETDIKTTLGMEHVSDGTQHMNRGGATAQLPALLDELNQRSPMTTLAEVVQQQFSDYIELNMGHTRTPRNVRIIKGRGSAKKITNYKVDNDIQIKFALGAGAKGKAYTKAMADWDTPGGRPLKSGEQKLPKAIDTILQKVENNTLKFIKRHKLTHPFDMLKLKGSPSPIDHAVAESPKIIIGNMFPHRTRPDMRLKVNKALFAVGKQPKKTATKLISAKTAKGKHRKTGRKGLPPVATKSKIDGKAGQNPIALRNLLNEVLPKAIAMQMISPRLQYRTGRFANSVRVENITQGPRGGNTIIETTYRKNPYETFAPGGKQYTTQRDPERLIKGTVRGIASGIIGGRFGVGVN